MSEITSSSQAMEECDRIEKEIESKNNQIDTVQQQISQVKLAITTMQRDIKTKEVEMIGLRSSIDAAKHSKENLEMQYNSAKRKYFTLGREGR